MSKNKQPFAWNVHSYLCDFIKFGDTKAAVLCGLSGGLVVWVSNLDDFYQEPIWVITMIAGCLAMVLLCLAFIFALFAIWPNLATFNTKRNKSSPSIEPANESPTKQFIFWKNILAHVNQNTFANELNGQTDEELTRQVAIHCFELATIADKKYAKITWASRCFAAGLVLIGLLFVCLKIQHDFMPSSDAAISIKAIQGGAKKPQFD